MAKGAVVSLIAGPLREPPAGPALDLLESVLLVVLLHVHLHVAVLSPLPAVVAGGVVGGDVELVRVRLGLLQVPVDHQGALRARHDGVMLPHVQVQLVLVCEEDVTNTYTNTYTKYLYNHKEKVVENSK